LRRIFRDSCPFLRQGNGAWLLHLVVPHYVINSLVFFAIIRYRLPIEPICLLLASWTVVEAWQRFRMRRQRYSEAVTENTEQTSAATGSTLGASN
jgi:hypothetical protein